MRFTVPLLLFLTCYYLQAQSILHFTRTSGWDHNTRSESFGMFSAIGNEIEATVVDDATGDPFSDLTSLLQFDVIVFSNTSGDAILSADQRQNFEAFIANGGSVMGIHAASDTYRHSTANGNNTGTWDFYPELIGASVQENPNHVAGTPQYSMQLTNSHASTTNLPEPWVKNEEYYYWEGGYYNANNTNVLEVEQTVGPNGQVNSYDVDRPMSWYRELPEGGRLFYTALGHAPDNYTSDALFRTHIKDAFVWLLDGTTGIATSHQDQLHLWPNPATDQITLSNSNKAGNVNIALYNSTGQAILARTMVGSSITLDLRELGTGIYFIRSSNGSVQKFVVH